MKPINGYTIFSLALLAASCLSGCSVFEAPTFTASADKPTVMRYDATERGGYILPVKSGVYTYAVIAEPAPDVAQQYTTALEVTVKDAKDAFGEAHGNLNVATQIIDLAKRGQSLQIARELCYRINEAGANGKLDGTATKAHYAALFQVIKEITEAEINASKAKADTAKADLVKAQNDQIDALRKAGVSKDSPEMKALVKKLTDAK